jgi:hypothetical protein
MINYLSNKNYYGGMDYNISSELHFLRNKFILQAKKGNLFALLRRNGYNKIRINLDCYNNKRYN